MTDEAVIGLVLSGNTNAFSEIVDRYRDSVFGMALRFTGNQNDAQDVSQEIFIRVYGNLHRFNGRSKFSTWLYRISYNLCIDWTRKHRRDRQSAGFTDDDLEIADSRAGPEERFFELHRRRELRKAINGLKEKYRNILILFYYQGLSYEVIAEILEIPVKTVETQLYRARKQLRSKLAGKAEGGVPDEMP
jgi:RNA polymerase sigma-70 factor (ECF subfamily)